MDLGHGITAIDTLFQRPRFDASHLVVEDGRAAFVDTGTSHSVPHLLAALEGPGLSRSDVDLVILTHVHLDHAGGAGELMRHLPEARLLVHPRGARHMIDPTKLVAGATAVYGADAVRRDYGEVVPVPAERVVEAGEGFVARLGRRSLLFFDTPGHARHHVCIWDEASESFFTGDTFGLCYPELARDGRPFVVPTTTPVQFDPEALEASIGRLLTRRPRSMILTHFSRVTDVERLAGDLVAQVRAHARIARESHGRPDRAEHLRRALEDSYLQRAADFGCPPPAGEVRALLALDVELNAQGLEVWLGAQ